MNTLQAGLVFTVCVLANAEVKRELGFTGIGAYHGAIDVPVVRYANRHVLISPVGKVSDADGPNSLLQIDGTGFGKGNLGFNTVPNVGNYGLNLYAGGHQGLGGYGINNGLNNAPLFTPILAQPLKGINVEAVPVPVKGITLDQGWRGIESGPGSIREGHAIADAVFGGGQSKNVIPVHENTFDIPQPQIHTGFSGFKQNNLGTFGGHGSFGVGGNRALGFTSYSPQNVNLGSPAGYNNIAQNFGPHGFSSTFGQAQGYRHTPFNVNQNYRTPVFAGQNTRHGGSGSQGFNAQFFKPSAVHGLIQNSFGKQALSSFNPQGAVGNSFGNHAPQHSSNYNSINLVNVGQRYGANQGSGYVSSKEYSGNQGSGHGANFVSSNLSEGYGITSQGDSSHGTSRQGSIGHEPSGHGNTGFSSSERIGDHGHSSANHVIPPGHGTNGHGPVHDEKATSFQSFIIHSYKAVPVYAKKKPEHKHEASGVEHDRSQSEEEESHNYKKRLA